MNQRALAAIAVGFVLVLPGAWIALDVFGTPGGGALDAVGVIVAYAVMVGSPVGGVVGAGITASVRRLGVGVPVGLVVGALVGIVSTVVAFPLVLGVLSAALPR
jgi:hypothetical protein